MPARVPGSVMAVAAVLGSACALSSVFDGLSWVWPIVGAAVLAAACGAAVRRWPLPVVVAGLLPATAFVVYVTAVFARPTAILGFVPTGRTLEAFRGILQEAASDVRVLVAPVPAHPGLVLLAVTAVFTVAGIVDILVSFVGRPALAGLPLLALFTVPTVLARHGLGLFAFVAAAAGFLGLLLVERRAAPAGTPEPRAPLSATAQRVGVAAVCLAVVAPLALPLNGRGLLASPAGAAADGATSAELSPLVQLSQQAHDGDTRPLLSVETNSPTYLRLTALDVFDGSTFRPAPVQAGDLPQLHTQVTPEVPAHVATLQSSVQVQVSPRLHGHYLPVPWPVSMVNSPGRWHYDARTSTVVSDSTDISSLMYAAMAEEPQPGRALLDAMGPPASPPEQLRQDLDLPGTMSEGVRELAHRLTDGVSSAYRKMVAIEAYLRGPLFTYDLNGAPTSADTALTEFLFGNHRGYCVQFASAMVVLARAVGVPARLAIGYTPGQPDGAGRYVIRAMDAHAWPEVWFPDTGWYRFEPTPRAGTSGPDQPTSAPSNGAPATTSPGGDSSSPPAPTPAQDAGAPASPSQDGGTGKVLGIPAATLHLAVPALAAVGSNGLVGVSPETRGVVVAVLVVAAGLAPPVIRRFRRRRLLRDGWPDKLWDELAATLVDLGLEPNGHETLRTVRLRLARDLSPEGAAALARMCEAVEESRFAPDGAAPAGPAVSSRDVELISTELARGRGFRRRVLAALAPPSVLRTRRTPVRPGADPRDPWAAPAP